MGLWNTPLYYIVHFEVRICTLCNLYCMVQLAALTVYFVHMRAYVGEGNGVYEITTEFKVVIVLSVDKGSFSISPSEPITPYIPHVSLDSLCADRAGPIVVLLDHVTQICIFFKCVE